MDTLHQRLAELADDAPRGGAPAGELWVRGKRAHRMRVTALAAAVLVAGAAGTGIGVGLADREGDRSVPEPAGTVGIALPIDYPVGEELPDLGDAPGPLAAVWLAPRVEGAAPEAVGLVAETGTFGTLSIDVAIVGGDDRHRLGEFALSPDGRRIAYRPPNGKLLVRDLVSGQESSPAFEFGIRSGYTWIDATHLVGYVAGGTAADGWVWEPGEMPKEVDHGDYPGSPYPGPYGQGSDLRVEIQGSGPRPCSWSPTLQDKNGGAFGVPVLCDVLGAIGSETMLGHGKSRRLPDDWNEPDDGNGTVVALDVRDADFPSGDPTLVATAAAPELVTFATYLIERALEAAGGAS